MHTLCVYFVCVQTDISLQCLYFVCVDKIYLVRVRYLLLLEKQNVQSTTITCIASDHVSQPMTVLLWMQSQRIRLNGYTASPRVWLLLDRVKCSLTEA